MTVSPERIIGSILGVGYIPFAPATFSSFISTIVIYALNIAPITLVFVALFLFSLGTILARKVETPKTQDPPSFVLDEFAAMPIALLFLPRNIKFYALAFVLFRLFDIIKPYPIAKLERLKGGFGVMLDDTLAAVYTNILIHIGRAIL